MSANATESNVTETNATEANAAAPAAPAAPSRPRRGPMGGHGHGPMMPGEKAKDFKGTLRKMLAFMGRFKVLLVVVFAFAIGSTIFNIVGPKVLSEATTELFNGIVAKIDGSGGIDYDRVAQILVFTLGLYVLSAACSFVQGWIMSSVSQRTCYQLRGAIADKIDRMPMRYFETRTYGEVLSRITNDVDSLSTGLNQSVTQLITSIFSIGDRSGGKLRPITFVGDEWCAMDRVEPLVKLLTLGRSYGAFWIGAVQSLSLLGEKYGERSGRPAILSNCGVKVAMKLGDADDRHFFSELVGKTTRHTRGTSTSRGAGGGSGSTSFSEHADDLIHPWEWTEMSPDRDGAIVVKMGENGVHARRAGTFRAPLADCTKTPTKGHFDLGTREHEHARRLEYQRMLDERASRHKDEHVPIWCPDFPKASTDAIDEDEWGAL